MKPFEKAVTILEYDKILEQLSACCDVEAGKEKILTLRPEKDYDRVLRLQKETRSARHISSVKGAPPLSAHPSIPDVLDRAGKGAVLNPSELLRIGNLLRSVDRTYRYGEALSGEDGVLGEMFRRLLPNRSLENEIFRCILSEDTLADDASPALHAIRRKIT
ncbi:MAG: endonuclease MutS2, partial [Clostridia bacterium]|nr:endonuclease MutS2 [Clostridia bacterium]